jgi:hypothetical protein
VLSVTALCIRIYRAGRRLSGVKLSCNLFGIIPAADSTSGIIKAVFSCHILVSSSFQSVHFCSISVTVL